MTSTNPKSKNQINRDDVNEMIENAIRRQNRGSTISSAIPGWILIGGYSFGLFHVVQSIEFKILYCLNYNNKTYLVYLLKEINIFKFKIELSFNC